MTKTIEDKNLLEFNLSDVFLFGKHLRHLPEILSYDDKGTKYFDLGVSGIIIGAQALMYLPFFQTLVENYNLLTC